MKIAHVSFMFWAAMGIGLAIMGIGLAMNACDEPQKTTDGKPDLDWASDHVHSWAKETKSELRGMSCVYNIGDAICDIVYTNNSIDQLKCFTGKNDETPRGCQRVVPMKANE